MQIERMVILAAGLGKRLMPLTAGLPKCLVPMHGRPLLDWQMAAARAAGVKEFLLIGGYKADALSQRGAKIVLNPDFETTNMVESLWCARAQLDQPFLLSYGDIVCSSHVISGLLASKGPLSIAVDRRWRPYWEMRFEDPLKDAESLRMDPAGRIVSIGRKTASIDEIEAQYIGLLAFSPDGARRLLDLYSAKRHGAQARRMFMTDLLQEAADSGITISGQPIEGGWLEIDSLSDLRLAESLSKPNGNGLEIMR